MFINRKSARGPASIFGMALLVMLVFGVFAATAAQASPAWRVDGSSFTGEETIAWANSPVEFKQSGSGATIKCSTITTGATKIHGNTETDGWMAFEGCELVGNKLCGVELGGFFVHGQLSEVGGHIYEKYTVPKANETEVWWEFYGSCGALEGEHQVKLSLAAEIGPEAVNLNHTFSHKAEEETGATGVSWTGGGTWTASGSATTHLTGKNVGKKYGPGAPTPVWLVNGKEFTGVEELAGTGGPVEITQPSLGSTISCGSLSAIGIISGGHEGSTNLTFSSCVVKGTNKCVVEPLTLKAHTALLWLGGKVYETYTPASGGSFANNWKITGSPCGLAGEYSVGGSFAAEIGPEAVNSTRTFSSKINEAVGYTNGLSWAGNGWFINGSVSVHMVGAKTGQKFGV
jgi:hypothetical protein